MTAIINWLGEGNPQLVRELRGRLKTPNLAIAAAFSIVGQLLLYLSFESWLPGAETKASRYCTGEPIVGAYHRQGFECITDLLGNVMIRQNLWWLDLFIFLSIISMAVLLLVGTYELISDLSIENRRGTFSFIRLSPRSASGILIGKILGVPVLLYLVVGLALPLHLGAGLAAGVPLSLILGFYGVLVASCACFYSAAVLFGLVGTPLGRFQAFFGSGVVLLFLLFVAILTNEELSGFSLDWLRLFAPSFVLPYLVEATFLPAKTVGYLDGQLSQLFWYGHPLWLKSWNGIGSVLLNCGVWTYWIWQGIKRRFTNPTATVWSKGQSYWLCGCFVVTAVGFSLQTTEPHVLYHSFALLFCLNLLFFLVLIAALSPHRQDLENWRCYQARKGRSLVRELVLGEKSPALMAIAINLVIATGYIVPSVLLFPLQENTLPVLLGLFGSASMILIYAIVAQLVLLTKTAKRSLWAIAAVGTVAIAPLLYCAVLTIFPSQAPWLWLFSGLPVVATPYAQTTTIIFSLLGQWLAICVLGWQMTRQLQQATHSDQALLK